MAKGKWHKWIEPDGILLIEGWARNGLTDEQIASNMGIATCTLYVWKERFTEIAEALKKSKALADLEVENALRKSAMGFVGPNGKYYPPNVVAQIFWLKNRQPGEWRDKPIEIDNDDETGIILMPPVIEDQDDDPEADLEEAPKEETGDA